VEVADDQDGTGLPLPDGTVLRLHRRPRPTATEGAAGQVSGVWDTPDGTRVQGVFATLHTP
ncbi:MAG: 1,4-alpha-glucan branching protein, partial [Streptomyces sp.]